MAGASSSSEGSRQYDVFINFRGEDTRRCFVCHLYKALEQKLLDTFIDSEELRKGDNLSELLKAIQGSRLSIVVLSKDYVSSTWCLRELVQILACKENQGQIVVPVFYEVDPSQVRKLEEAFAKHESNPKVDNEEVKSWKSALTNAANLSGYDSTKYPDDDKLIETIVEDTFNTLIRISPSKTDGLIGRDSHLDEMDALLKLEEDDCRTVGIWGMGGIGKTTIATAVYDKIGAQFYHKCFLRNVKEHFPNGGVQMAEELLCRILDIKDRRTVDGGLNNMMERLRKKKVLVVLDDVDNRKQIDIFSGLKPSFLGGSRIIITTRDRKLLSEFLRYKPKTFATKESLELFSRHAFRTIKCSKSYDAISRRAIEYAHGLPLALEVLGGLLDGKTVQDWVYELKKMEKIPITNLHEIGPVLRASYDGLDDCQKNIFLDTACFFRGEPKYSVTKFHESCDYFPQNGLPVLIERSLLTVSKYDNLEMHDLIQEMGRDIVRQESMDPGRRSRLWYHEDVVKVLAQNKGRKTVQVIIIDLSKLNEVLCVNKAALSGMKNLRMLQLSGVTDVYGRFGIKNLRGLQLSGVTDVYGRSTYKGCKQFITGSGDLKFSNELRVLVWHGYPLESLPSDNSTKNLIEIDMSHSNLKQLWKETKSLQNLVYMDLSYSVDLIRTPDFSNAKKLKWLNLAGCSSLLEVDPSISALESIFYLDLSGCSNLGKFPNISGTMKELRYLYLVGSAITEVPSSVNDLPGLEYWSLRDCRELRRLPSSIHMKSLEWLDLSGCSKLTEFPEISQVLENFRALYLVGTAIKELPSSIDNLTNLHKLSMSDCKSLVCLPEEICSLARLRELHLTGCSNMEKLPENFANLTSLWKPITVAGSGIKQLPNWILRKKSVSFKGCKEITAPFSSWPIWNHQIPSGSVLRRLDLSDCNLLELSDAIAHLSSLQDMNLSGNKNLESLPAALNRLVHLYRLEVEGCMRLKSIPELPSSVRQIYADDCTSLETVSVPCRRGIYLTFANCLKLQVKTDLFIDTVETIVDQVDASGYGFRWYMFLPGSDIPDGFNHQSRGSSVTVQLSPDWLTDEFQGLAICAISNLRGGAQNRKPLESAECWATFKANDGQQDKFYSKLLPDSLHTIWEHRTDIPLESDHMFLAYLSSDTLGMRYSITAGKKYTEATFRIVGMERENEDILNNSDVYSSKDCSWITSCGVELISADKQTFWVREKDRRIKRERKRAIMDPFRGFSGKTGRGFRVFRRTQIRRCVFIFRGIR